MDDEYESGYEDGFWGDAPCPPWNPLLAREYWAGYYDGEGDYFADFGFGFDDYDYGF